MEQKENLQAQAQGIPGSIERTEELGKKELEELTVRLWLRFLRSNACDRDIQYTILTKVRDNRNSLALLFKTPVLERWEISSLNNLIEMLRLEWGLDVLEIHIDDIFKHLNDKVYPKVYPVLIYGYQANGMFFFIPSSTEDEENEFLWVNVPENHPFSDIFWKAEKERGYGIMLLGALHPNIYVSSTEDLTYLAWKELKREVDIYGEIVASDGKAWAIQYMAPFLDMINDAGRLVSFVRDYIYYPLDTFVGLYVYSSSRRREV